MSLLCTVNKGITSVSRLSSTRSLAGFRVSLRNGRVVRHVATCVKSHTKASTNFVLNGQGKASDLVSTKYRPPVLKTLRPEKMAELGQSLLTLSDKPYLKTTSSDVALFLCRPLTGQYLPTDKSGVFYYHQDPSLSPLAGEIRFRLCKSVEPSDFADGQDHTVRSASESPPRPWALRLHSISHYSLYEGLRNFLVDEKLVSRGVIDDFGKLPPCRGTWLYQLDQPFLLKLKLARIYCAFVTRNSLVQRQFEGIYKDSRLIWPQKFGIPYTGTIRVRLELSTLPEHKNKGPTLVMRILETVTPIKCLVEDYDGYWQIPEPGTLVSRQYYGRQGHEPWAIHLNTQAHGQAIMDFIRLTSPGRLEALEESI